jgi:hypothetical protein
VSFDPSFAYDQAISPDLIPPVPTVIGFDPDFAYGQPISANGIGLPFLVSFDPDFAYGNPFSPDTEGPGILSFDPGFGFGNPYTPGLTVTSPTAPVATLPSVIQRAINLGYAQTANLIGTPYRHYRPTPSAAITGTTWIDTLNLSFAQNGNFSKPGKVGNDEWYGYYDATTVQPGDYLTNGQRTYFVASQQPLLPYLLVYCERVITLSTVGQTAGTGAGTYGGDASVNGSTVLTSWPASIVQGSRGERGDITLPDDVRSPWWTVRLPATPGIVIQNSMFLTDDLGRRYSISSAEQTEYGWRLVSRTDQT